MDERLASVRERLETREDPRLNPDLWEGVPATESRKHPLVLVGTVHDHPASSYRVAKLAGEFDPAVVALELPAVAIPYYERQAETDTNDRFPGCCEMTTAIAAAPDARVVGIDTFGLQFYRQLTRTARELRASADTMYRVLREVSGMTVHALTKWVKAYVQAPEAESTNHDSGDGPVALARDERKQVARSRSLLGAVQRPHGEIIDATRERNMAQTLDGLRREGPVLAVVGAAHLSRVAERLRPSA